MGRYSRPLMGHAATTHRNQTSYHPLPRTGTKGSYAQEPWEEETFPTEDGYEYNDWNESTWQRYSAEEHEDWEEDADLETFLAGESDWIHRDLLDPDILDSYVEEECTSDKNLYEAYRVYKEARDTLNHVRRGRGFWPVIAIPAPDGRPATLAVRNTDESFRGKGRDSKNTTHKGKSKGSKSGKSGKSKSSGKSSVKRKGDPLKQRFVSRTQCRLCGEEGHWEEDCPQADVDMPLAKRRVTFSRPPVGTGVSQAWGVETWTVAPSAESAELRLTMWTSQEIQESANLMGVTTTMPEEHAILDCGAALDCIGEVAAARTAQAITASGETRRPAVVDKVQRFKFGGVICCDFAWTNWWCQDLD